MRFVRFSYVWFLVLVVLGACRRPDTLFHIPKRLTAETLSTLVAKAEDNYTIQKGDILELEVFANKGELIIDPNFELLKVLKRDMYVDIRDRTYTVRGDGRVKFPFIRDIDVVGKRLADIETSLELLYSDYYNDPYVLVRCVSRRVVVLGAVGGQVIALPHEETHVLEVLAQAGGIYEKGKARYVLLLRGDLANPKVYRMDLSTISGLRQSIVPLQPNDIVYVVPYRRAFDRSVNYVSVLAQSLTAVLTFFLLLRGF